jgi:hypothetical protein
VAVVVTVTSYIEPHVSTVRSFEDHAVKSERNGVIIGTRSPGFRYTITATTAAAATLTAADRERTVAPSGLPKMFSIVRHGIGKTESEREEHAAAKGARRMARKTVAAPAPQVCPVPTTPLQHK